MIVPRINGILKYDYILDPNLLDRNPPFYLAFTKNKEVLNKKANDYHTRDEYKERRKKSQHEYYVKNKEKIMKQQKEYRAKNNEH